MLPIQLVLLTFFLVASLKVVARYRQGQLSGLNLLWWLLVWVVAGMVVIRPNLTAAVARLLGIGRGADVVIYFSLAILFFLLFRLSVRFEKMQRDLTTVTRARALRQAAKDETRV